MKQTSLGLGQSNKRTRRRVFLEEMDGVVPWSDLVTLICPFMPEGRRCRPPFVVEVMLRIHFMRHGLVCKRRASRAGSRRGRSNQRNEFAPRHHQLHLVEEHRLARAPRTQVQSQFGLFLHDAIVPRLAPSDHRGLHGVLNTIPREFRQHRAAKLRLAQTEQALHCE